MKYLLLAILLSSCASVTFEKSVFHIEASPGRVKYIEVPTSLTDLGELNCSDKRVEYFHKDKMISFYFAEGYWSSVKERKCTFSKTDRVVINIKIVPFKYPSEKLNVDKKRVVLSKKDQRRVAKERKITKKIYSDYIKKPLFVGPFSEPLNSHKTSIYGTKRVFNNLKHSTHLGTDYRARKPTPIPVTNKGKVVFAGSLFYAGNAVIVDHGARIFTMYGHLSKIKVKVGQVIPKGKVVGLSGATGRVSGPHLHWGVKVQGESVSGVSLVEESNKEFN